MTSVLDRRLLFVTGKGGVGKSSVASGLALLAAEHGRKTLVCEVDAKGELATFFETASTSFAERNVAPNLWAMSMDTEASLREYLKLHLRIPVVGRIGPLARAFDFVATAAPGVKEILTVGKLCYEVREATYDLVVVDAPATGHIVGQLTAPQAINDLVKVGLIRSQTDWMLDILSDAATTGLFIVTTPEEMPVNETLELAERVKTETTVDLAGVIVNRVLPELFGRSEEEIFERLRASAACAELADLAGGNPAPVLEAARLAVTLRRTGAEHLERLRDGLDPSVPMLYLPMLFTRTYGLRTTRQVAQSLGEELGSDGEILMAAERRHEHPGATVVTPRRRATDKPPSLDGLLASREIIVACGPGGVGKTTTAAAAAAMAASRLGGKVLVLTVDPARRLANALGLQGFGNVERRVPDEAFALAGERPRGELWAAMLDTKESWDALIRRHAPDERTRDEILANPLYAQISGRFVQSHDYIAMERLYEIHSGGAYDLIVVDTPPTRNALDFLDAPERLADFFSSRLLRWLIVPYRSRIVGMASKPFYQVADRILGTQFLADISEFFILFQTMYDGFIERAQAVERLLSDRRTAFIVVSTLEAAPLREAEFFADALAERDLHLGAIVLNKVLPAYLRDTVGRDVAQRLRDEAPELAGKLAPSLDGVDATQLARVLAEIGGSFLDYRVVARREAEQQSHLAHSPDVLVSVPFFDSDVHDMTGLIRLGERLWGETG